MSSRLCVKNLPKGADEKRLREVFSRKGEVTDAKVIRTKCKEALKYFNNTYIDTCKITCEVARKIGDPDAPRPWSRHSLKKPEYASKDKTDAEAVDALPKVPRKQDDMTDADFFKSKIKKNWSDSESDDEDSGDHSNSTTDDENPSDESQDADNQLVDLKGDLNKKSMRIRMLVRNVLACKSEDDLVELCSQYGDVEQAHIVVDKTLSSQLAEVVENIARKNGISKSELLDREADDLAVRIALGETHVIAETKKYLSSTSEEELAAIFQKHGSLDKIVLPPTRVFALVVFVEATEARHAFKKLLYTRYKYYHTVQSRSVFVKNLNFKTTDESLRQHFITKLKSGSLKSVKVKKHVKNGKNVSMGFGFVEFDSVETATSVCKDLQCEAEEGKTIPHA
ncbi:hypothetical protein HU200_013290 [Digitaria exilis]|uniref:RRM domain-containing protein n=1 Tax=Digitaria exilis TaxID=1010633 RepID=A0A835KJS2_9POAL|nr:hypothetical protein HU200_013290 [Digitaria exilis]